MRNDEAEEHDKKRHLGKWHVPAVTDAKMVKKIARAKDLLLKVQNSLSITSVILGYTFVKWTFVLIHYLQDGVVPEGNIFLLFLMVPFGVPIFVVGIIKQVIAIYHMKKAMKVLKEGVNKRSLVFIVTNYVLMAVDLVEMILIFAVAS